MDTKTDGIEANLKRINGLLQWWGMSTIPGIVPADAQIKRLQQLAVDLQAAYGEASTHQVQALFATNEIISRMLTSMLSAHTPQELLTFESRLVFTLVEGALLQIRAWAESSQQFNERCIAFVREIAATSNGDDQTDASTRKRATADGSQ